MLKKEATKMVLRRSLYDECFKVEFKEQVAKEAQETNNEALAARRYEISPSTIHTWIRENMGDSPMLIK